MREKRDGKGKWVKGYKRSSETLVKLSKSLKGIPSWNKGKRNIYSKATLRKMSLAKLGKPGRLHTREVKERLSISKLGSKNPMFGKLREKSGNWKGGMKRGFVYSRIRRARHLRNGGSHTIGDWENLKAQYNWACLCCKLQEPEVKLSKDHIIPVVNGGSDNIENIQPLCRRCNAKKHTKSTNYLMGEIV